jgi:hypothetical protein
MREREGELPVPSELKGEAAITALRPQRIIETVDELKKRINDRFPGSGLSEICGDALTIARATSSNIERVSRPNWLLRFCLALMQAAALLGLVLLVNYALSLKGSDELSDMMQGLDAAVSLAIVLGGATFFVWSIEARWKRHRALASLHELRSIVHVIDMHQLKKDPTSDRRANVNDGTPAGRALSSFELMRYLDYCSEMLSLMAKCAALYAERLSDSVIVDTVGDIERLTSDLSNKIWQKIAMVQQMEGRDMPSPIHSPTGMPRLS